MATRQKILLDFVKDFNLEINEENEVCFSANIYYYAPGLFMKLESPVHIVTTHHQVLTVIYLLHTDLAKYGIPHKIIFNPRRFEYIKDLGLNIMGVNKRKEKYKLGIVPLDKKCADHTLTELKAKKYN